MPTRTEWIFVGIGAVGAYLLVTYIPSTMKTLINSSEIKSAGCNKCNKSENNVNNNVSMSLENIPGIDLNSLNICRQKQLM